MQFAIQIAQYTAFAYGLIHLISSNAKLVRRTPHDIREDDSKRRTGYATHGLNITFLRLTAITLTMAVTVRYADLKLFWGIVLLIYVVGFIVTSWMMTKRLPEELPQISKERVDREVRVKWWHFAFQFILLATWLYSWRHLYS